MKSRSLLCVAITLSSIVALAHGGEAPRFETHVAPIFKAHCVRCHNANSSKAELDLSTAGGVFKGGESGGAVAPGKLDESLLFEMVHEGHMPPEKDKRLAKAEVETIRRWIEAGTPLESGATPSELIAAAEVSNHDIEPLMLLRCAVCHGQRMQEGGLDLRTKASMLKGGKSGPVIVLGKPAESLILKKIKSGQMPPNKRLISAGVKPFGAAEIEKLSRWIELGAPEVRVEPDVAGGGPDPLVSDKERRFWSFQPPRSVMPPAITPASPGADRVRNPIDAFLLRKLHGHRLTFSRAADKLTLLRRASFDLTGLPPGPDEVAAFLADEGPTAYERMIERLLSSRRYGERWARFWLDAAGYADSEGKRSADPIRPHAYKYRDYVIRSFNADKPYDRFLLEQIAGDELADYENAEQVTPEILDNLVATGFLRMAPDGTGSDVVNRVPERMEVVADELDIFGSTVLGLTIKCARCHSHKYDPIPQRDYYRLVDVFKGAYDVYDWLKPSFVPGQTKVKKPGRVIEMSTTEERRDQERFNRQLDEKIAEEKARLVKTAETLRKRHLNEQLARLPAESRDEVRAAIATPKDQRDARQRELAAKHESKLVLTDKALKSTAEYKAADRNIRLRIRALEGQKASAPRIRALWDRGAPSPTYIYRRGDHLQPARLVGPGVLSVLTDGKTPFEVKPPWEGSKKTGRRLALARWLTRPDHPLTARVMVNRIWNHHFGQGIVKSLGNFGWLGTRPTHPDLLDWLAREFVASGWSIKHLHRLMMTSATYRQSSRVSEALLRADPDNSLLSRMPLRRMDAEELRDSLLLAAGRLDERPFGRPDPVDVRRDGLVISKAESGGWRRSVYVLHRRKEIPTVLETFDQPQMNPNCQQRVNSNVAQQALYLLNNAMVRQLSRALAERVKRESSPGAWIERLYLITLSRPPSDEEREIGRQAMDEFAEQWRKTGTGEVDPIHRALTAYGHTLLNSAAFLYVD